MSQTILFKDGLRIGKRELQLLQSLGLENLASLAQALAEQLPAVVTTTGSLNNELKVTAGDSTVSVATGSALLANGSFLLLNSSLSVAVPEGSSGLKLVLKAASSPYAPGTISLSTAADRFTLTYVPGSGNSLTAADIYAANEYIRLQNGGSSLGTLRIESVNGNTIVLAEAVSGSTALSGLLHAPAGKFFPGYPLNGVSTDLISYDKAEARLETSGYTAAEDEIVLATVSRATSVTVADVRVALRSRGLSNIVNSMIADNASIAESKLNLSAALLKAKSFAQYLEFAEGKLFTTQPDFYVRRNGTLRKVLTEDDSRTSVFSGLSVSPASVNISKGATQTLTASVASQVSGSTVTYAFRSLNEAVATVSQASQGGTTATVTGVADGEAQIEVSATAAAYGNAVAAYETRVVTVKVGATNGVLTNASVTPSNLTVLSTLTSNFPTLTASVTSPVSTPNATYTWAYGPNSSSLFTLSSTSGSTITVTPKAKGNGTITMVASAPANGNYTATTLPAVTVNVTVTDGLTLKAEPAYRVKWVRANGVWSAKLRWGVNGTATYNGLSATVTLSADDADVTFAQGVLAGQAFYDGGRRSYLILDNTATSNNSLTLTLQKLDAIENPSGSSCAIRSLAKRYEIEVLGTGTDATTAYVLAQKVNDPLTNAFSVDAFANAMVGTKYNYRLTSYNSDLTPGSLANNLEEKWGGDEVLSLSIPVNWITSAPTPSGVIFRWSLLKDASPYPYSVANMETEFQCKVGDNQWSGWYKIDDNVPGATELTQFVPGPPSTLISFRLRVLGSSGLTVNNPSAGYNAETSATTLSDVNGGLDLEYVYPFTLDSNSTWQNVGTVSSPRYVLPLTRSTGTGTTFTSAVSVSRIDIKFAAATPLAQANGTAVLKAVVYPEANPTMQIASNLIQESSPPTYYVSTTNIDTPLAANANSQIIVGLEYAGSGNPNDLDPTGAGTVSVWFRGKPGEDA